MRRLIFMALAGVLCIFFGSAARAQRLDGTLRVTITDKSQASIEDAKVMAENQATKMARLLGPAPRYRHSPCGRGFCGCGEVRPTPRERANNYRALCEVHRCGCAPRYGQNRHAVR